MGWIIVVAFVSLLSACGRDERAPAPRPETPVSRFPGVGFLDTGDAICTGTLLSPRLVLTAGHCVHGRKAGDLHFTLSARPLEDTAPPYAAVTEIALHPEYNERDETPGVDVAVVRLAATDYGDAPGAFFPLGDDRDLASGTALVSVGYGENADGSHALKRVKQVSFTGMADLPLRNGAVPRGLVIVARGARGEIGCAGDSGSPLFLDVDPPGAIRGVYSTSESHDDRHYPERLDCKRGIAVGNYIAVAAFREWVVSRMAQAIE